MSQSFIRVPPDSTGKRTMQGCLLGADFTNLVGVIDINDIVSGSASGLLGHVSKVNLEGADFGEVYIILFEEGKESLTIGETLTFVGVGTPTTAIVSKEATPYYASKVMAVGGNNPNNIQNIDEKGAANVRFYEGSHKFNSFGMGITANNNIVGIYDLSIDDASGLYTWEITGDGTIAHSSAMGVLKLSAGNANNSRARITTNKDHYKWLGNGLTAYSKLSLSDNSIVGSEKHWGLFDEKCGIGFKQYGSITYVTYRNTINGVTTDVEIPQSDWNVDKLDGQGLSGEILDVTLVNTYWMDYETIIRFGILSTNGERIICHEVKTKSQLAKLFTQSLPMRVNVENHQFTAVETFVLLKEQFVVCEGNIDYTYWRNMYDSNLISVSGDTMQHVISIQSKETYAGDRNRTNVYPETFTCNVNGGRVKLQMYWSSEVVGGAFNQDNGGTIEANITATGINLSGSTLYKTWYLNDSTHDLDLTKMFDKNDEALLLNYDLTKNPMSFVATKLSGTPTIEGSIIYKELR